MTIDPLPPVSPTSVADAVLARFLRYVRYDTRSDESSTSYPSTPGQLVLLRDLALELRTLGLADATLDAHGYVTATVPATSPKPDVPVIGFIAHVDTSPEMPGKDVSPIVHLAYDGRDLVLPDDPQVVLRAGEIPTLAERLGDDIVTASGATLLGADDKAGVAEIVTAAEYLVAHPEIRHGAIRLAFTPDEEVGRGTKHFDVAAFGAACAYTMDGGARGELEYESFSADVMTVTFVGVNAHPGYAKDRLVNAIKGAAAFIDSLSLDGSPERTQGTQGFVHPYTMQAGVERAAVRVLLRDFDTAGLAIKARHLEELARNAAARFPGMRVECLVEAQYRNMRQILDRHPAVVEHAREAMRRCGIEPIERPIRGGTDGSMLSFMGLPTPNLFAGEQHFHSRQEWISVQDMAHAVAVIIELSRVWEARA